MHGWHSELMDRKVVEVLSLSLSVSLSLSLSATYLFVYLHIYLPAYLPLPTSLPPCLSVCLSGYLLVYLSTYVVWQFRVVHHKLSPSWSMGLKRANVQRICTWKSTQTLMPTVTSARNLTGIVAHRSHTVNENRVS